MTVYTSQQRKRIRELEIALYEITKMVDKKGVHTLTNIGSIAYQALTPGQFAIYKERLK